MISDTQGTQPIVNQHFYKRYIFFSIYDVCEKKYISYASDYKKWLCTLCIYTIIIQINKISEGECIL